MNESVILEIDGNLYPLTSLLTAQDSSRIQEGPIADRVRHRINSSFFDSIGQELASVAEAQGLFTSAILPWVDYYGDSNTPSEWLDDYANNYIHEDVAAAVRPFLSTPVAAQAEQIAQQVVSAAIDQLVASKTDELFALMAANEYVNRALRGDGVKPALDGQQLMAHFNAQCQELCALIDTRLSPNPQ